MPGLRHLTCAKHFVFIDAGELPNATVNRATANESEPATSGGYSVMVIPPSGVRVVPVM